MPCHRKPAQRQQNGCHTTAGTGSITTFCSWLSRFDLSSRSSHTCCGHLQAPVAAAAVAHPPDPCCAPPHRPAEVVIQEQRGLAIDLRTHTAHRPRSVSMVGATEGNFYFPDTRRHAHVLTNSLPRLGMRTRIGIDRERGEGEEAEAGSSSSSEHAYLRRQCRAPDERRRGGGAAVPEIRG
jgi:hypothetical protein